MGYNGSNRRGAKSSMFKKSSYKSSSNMLFGKKGLLTGMLKVGSSIAKDGTKGIPRENDSENINITNNDSTENIVIYVLVIVIIVSIFIYIPLLALIVAVLLFGTFLKK